MRGVDRKIRPEDHCLASLGLMPDSDCEGRIFLYTSHTHDRFFYLHTFCFWTYIFLKDAVTLTADVLHIVMALQ